MSFAASAAAAAAPAAVAAAGAAAAAIAFGEGGSSRSPILQIEASRDWSCRFAAAASPSTLAAVAAGERGAAAAPAPAVAAAAPPFSPRLITESDAASLPIAGARGPVLGVTLTLRPPAESGLRP